MLYCKFTVKTQQKPVSGGKFWQQVCSTSSAAALHARLHAQQMVESLV